MTPLAIVGVILGALATVLVAVITARQAHRTVVTAPYDQLSNRVSKLEKQVDTMRRIQWRTDNDLDTAVDALWEQQLWIESGAVPPPPTITSRALQVVHRRRAERAESQPATETADPQENDPRA